MSRDIVDTWFGGSMDLGRYAVDAVVIEGRSYRSVAASVGRSKSWVAKQVGLFRSGGYGALGRRSSVPLRRPGQSSPELEDEIILIRKRLTEEGFDGGPKTIEYHLQQRHGTSPARSTIYRVLKRRGFVVPQPRALVSRSSTSSTTTRE